VKLDQTTQFAFKEATKETPDLRPTLAIIPLSAGVGGVVLLGALLVCWGLGEPAKHALVVGGLTMASCALVAFWRLWADRIYMGLETIIGQDLNQDGYIGTPQAQEFVYQVSENTSWRASLPAPEPVLREWAQAALSGGSLAYSSWWRQFGTPPRFQDGADRYREFRRALVGSGMAIERGTHSLTLTDRGHQMLEDWLDQAPEGTPLLTG
jgi:hypothetical protein